MNRFYLAAILTLATLPPATAEPVAQPVWMMVQHDVADLDSWRKAFDSGLKVRQEAGELQFDILTVVGPPSSAIGIFEWTSEDAALEFVNSASVRSAMEAAGVISEPVISLSGDDPRYWVTSDDRANPASGLASNN